MKKTNRTLACLVLGSILMGASLPAHSSSLQSSAFDDDVLEVSLQRLADLDYEPGDEIDKDILALSGRRIRITGYMRTGTIEGAKWFDLTNDSCGCGTSKLQHFVRVSLESGTTRFQPSELSLTGIFTVGEKEDEDGFVESIFRLKIKELED